MPAFISAGLLHITLSTHNWESRVAEFFASYGLFLLKVLTFVVAILIIMFAAFAMSSRGKKAAADGKIEITKLNEQYEDMRESLSFSLLDEEAQKLALKEKKAEEKKERKRDGAEARIRYGF